MTLETKYKLARIGEAVFVVLFVLMAIWFIVLTVQSVVERLAQ